MWLMSKKFLDLSSLVRWEAIVIQKWPQGKFSESSNNNFMQKILWKFHYSKIKEESVFLMSRYMEAANCFIRTKPAGLLHCLSLTMLKWKTFWITSLKVNKITKEKYLKFISLSVDCTLFNLSFFFLLFFNSYFQRFLVKECDEG